MKILCVSDQIDPLVYSPSIKERFADIDLVLSAGDLPLDYLEFIVSSLDRPLFFVFGHHNLKEYADYRYKQVPDLNNYYSETKAVAGAGTTYLGAKVKKEGSLIIAGLGGSLRYNNGENQFTNFQMNLEICKLLPALFFNRIFRGRYLDILLTHASPEGIGDRDDPCHRGFKPFLWFMRKFKPKYLIHGHIHLYDLADIRVRHFEKTVVINAFSHYIINTDDIL
jgi:Icc-related predicted phosphoesterase